MTARYVVEELSSSMFAVVDLHEQCRVAESSLYDTAQSFADILNLSRLDPNHRAHIFQGEIKDRLCLICGKYRSAMIHDLRWVRSRRRF